MTKILLFSWIIFLSPLSAFAEKIIFASPEDLPPKIYKENGELKGTYVDIIREIGKRMHVEVEFQQFPWARAMAMVKAGEVDAIFPPLKTPDRLEFLYFPSEPMSYTRNVLFARKKSGLKIKKLSDLNGLMVGINDQYSYGAEFDEYKKHLKIDLSRNEELQIKKLADASMVRMDVAAASEEAFRFLIKRMNYTNQFEIVYTISEKPSYVAFTKAKGEKMKVFAEKYSHILSELKTEGFIQKVTDKYFN